MNRTLKTSPKKRRVVEKEVATALLELANKMSLKRSLDDLSLAESLLSLREERIDGKNVNEGTANDRLSEENTNIDDFGKSSPEGRLSPIQTRQHVAVQVCTD